MAVKLFKVFYNKSVSSNALGGGGTGWVVKELTKTQAEAAHFKYGTEPVKIYGPLEQCKVCEVSAETAEAAATAVVHLLGANQAEGELQVAETSAVEKKAGN